MREYHTVGKKDSRQAMLEKADIGDNICLSRRIVLQHGFDPEIITRMTDQLRGVLSQQITRCRRKFTERKFTVENGSFMTRDHSLHIVAVATRVE